MISVFLPAYPFRGVEAPYLWFFYRIINSISEPVSFIAGKEYLLPLEYWKVNNRWEMEDDSQIRLGYTLPEIDNITENHDVNIIDESFLSSYLGNYNFNPNKLFEKFITEIIPELELEIVNVLNKNSSIECILSWCNCPSLNSAAQKFGVKVVNMELGPLRSPYYLSTAYFDFTGVNGNTEAERRYIKSDFYSKDETKISDLYQFFSNNNIDESVFINNNDSSEIVKEISSSSDLDKEYDIGVVLQVENDSNIIAFSKTFNNQSLLDYTECYLPGSKLIRAHPGSRFSLRNSSNLDNSSSSLGFLKRCKEIVTINSSVGLEALLLNIPVTILGECSYSFCNVENIVERTRRLTFYLFSYLVPFELLFDIDYIRFRLNTDNEHLIIKKHIDYYISLGDSMSKTEIEKKAVSLLGDGSIEKRVIDLECQIKKISHELELKNSVNRDLIEQVELLETRLGEKAIDIIVDVVVPVYGGKQETVECIESALLTLPNWAQLVVINDASPEPDLTEWLRQRSKGGEFLLIENEENLGFVATVNRGMKLNLKRDILLLNSDVEVANDWLERIREAAYSYNRVGSITPFSNNATICSFPNFCEDNDLFMNLDVQKLDDHFSTLGKTNNLIEIPTGVGFCMYIRRDCLNEVGYFDVETFGRGYGEENDWCQRAAKAGWPNFHQLNVFVYHKGGVSFAGEQNPRKTRALELLNNLHPNYTKDVMDFIVKDPAKNARSEMLLRITASKDVSKVLLVSHKMGGGVNTHLIELAKFYNDEVNFLLLVPEEDGKSVALTLNISESLSRERFIIDIENGYQTLVDFLNFVGVGHIHFHHLIGINDKILDIKNHLSCGYDVTIHDYYFINSNPSLTDKNGIFAGDIPEVRDRLCNETIKLPSDLTASQWREKFSAWLNSADRVIFPSADTKKRFCSIFPDTTINSIVAWHPDYEVSAPYPQVSFNYTSGERLKILVLGAISREKGALMLEEVANNLKHENIEFHLLGYAFRPLESVITHGAYSSNELSHKLMAIQPHVMWYPAQWPETYSYTLSAALENGIPIIAPNIGAFGERLAGRKFTRIVEWDSSVRKMNQLFLSLYKNPETFFNKENVEPFLDISEVDIQKDFYRKSYIKPEWFRESMLGRTDIKSLLNSKNIEIIPEVTIGAIGRKEKLLALIWRISQIRCLSTINKIIPFRIKRYIKRRLSRRAIHEIIS